MKEAFHYLEEKIHLSKGDKVVAAISGGPDSMALLHLLSRLQDKKEIEVICAHVNHNVRKESDKEKDFVESFCKKHHIVFEFMKIESYGEDNFHNEARNKRYDYFNQIIRKYHAKYLFTAHHGDDLMETILMRIVRGSTLKGYSGFAKEVNRDTYQIIRPFIQVTKAEILKYNEENHIEYVLDASNQKDGYTRNRYRKYIVPEIKKEDSSAHKKFYKYSKTLLEANDYIENLLLIKMDEICPKGHLKIETYQKEDSFIQKKIISKLLEQFYQDDLMYITDKHVASIQKMIDSPKSNGKICLPGQIDAIKSYQTLTLEKRRPPVEHYEIEMGTSVFLPNHHTITQIKESEETSNFICRLDSTQIHLPLTVRSRKKGDRILIKGMSKTKKISDIFINEKIEIKEREIYPIVEDAEGKIVWLPGLKKTQFDKSKEEKYDIILKYY